MQLNYKTQIEALQEHSDYEAQGDALFLDHADPVARLEWAFYRPSGSHPRQVADSDVLVSIMAFNHSRLPPKARFDLLNPAVIHDERLRVKIRNRSRMLFRAMVDDDFWELASVLEKYPQFWDLAFDQLQNGRLWNENYADPQAASRLLWMAPTQDERFVDSMMRRLQHVEDLNLDAALALLERLLSQAQNLHEAIKIMYTQMFEAYIQTHVAHSLQRIVWHKRLAHLTKEHP